MTETDIQIAICGSAGDGTIAAGGILNQAMARAGYKVIAFDVYPAEIRGFGECIARSRITSAQVYSLKGRSDVLISLDDGHAIGHVGEVRDYGAVIYDDAPISKLEEGHHISGHVRPGQLPYGLSMRALSEKATSAAKSRNMVALGYLVGLYDMPRQVFHETIIAKFEGKAGAVTEGNLKAFDIGYEAGRDSFRLDFIELGQPPADALSDAVMINGNSAIVRGCLDAGVDTFFGYPITPATTILEMLAQQLPRQGGRVLQTEDEISAISATIGAGYAGARAATATSGPGLALMTEMMGLGVMAEVPCVVFVSQRGGPSTGMPTKTEQSDLNLALYGGSGDAQRIVMAPTNVEGCYRCAGRAFELAEKYQCPVIVLLDLYLSNRLESVAGMDKTVFVPSMIKGLEARARGPYQRFALTEDGVSPRAVPGDLGGIHTVTGLEHNEAGRPKDTPEIHEAMTAKRHAKLAPAIDHPDLTTFKRFGDEGQVEVGVLAWGSTFGEALEAMLQARAEGIRCAAVKVVMLSPLPVAEIQAFCADCREVLVPEVNHVGQFAQLVTGTTGCRVHRFDRVPGRPMPVEDILAEIRRLAKAKAEAKARIVAA